MSFMVDLRIDIRTKEMLNITPCKTVHIMVVVWWWFGAKMAGLRYKNAFKFILQVFILSQEYL